MVLVLDGFLDAGNAAGLAAQHLLTLSDGSGGGDLRHRRSSTTTGPGDPR